MLRAVSLPMLSVLVGLLGGATTAAMAETCSRAAVRTVVDETSRALGRIHEESQPTLNAGFRKLKEQRGWSEEDYLEKANQLLVDARIESLDAKASELLARMDGFAAAAESKTDCAKPSEIEATARELQATVREKARYSLARLETLAREPERVPAPPVAAASPAPPPSAPQPSTSPGSVPPSAAATSPPTTPQKTRPREQAPSAKSAPPSPSAGQAPPRKPDGKSWSATATEDRREVASQSSPQPPASGPPPPATMPSGSPPADGYTIDEIREASRGFFGTLSSELGNVIEYAFANSGRPAGYILGTEGGGAFIAGVRYGRGTLYARDGSTREVFWHGPSIGYDFGAAGSRTLFLVYRMSDPLEIFSGFSGVDGSAYLVGGVGMTLLTDGKLVLAPIRSGLGLRLGANIGYVRFTSRPTWNPF